MAGLLTPVSTSYKTPNQEAEIFLAEVSTLKTSVPKNDRRSTRTIRCPASPAEALETLRSEPDYDSLISTLSYLKSSETGFSITLPSSLSAQLVHVLVSETAPTYWNVLQTPQNSKNASKQKHLPISTGLNSLLSCLRSVMGLSAVLLALRGLVQKSKESEKSVRGQSIQVTLSVLLDLLAAILEGDRTIELISQTIWNTSGSSPNQKTLWHDFLSLTSSKILSTAAETEDIINGLDRKIREKLWISEGRLYADWLACNIGQWAHSLARNVQSDWNLCSETLSKSFRLGHTDNIVKKLLELLIFHCDNDFQPLQRLLHNLKPSEQKTFLLTSLEVISTEYLPFMNTVHDDGWWYLDAGLVSAAAGTIQAILAGEESRKEYIVSWLSSSSGAGIGEGIAIRRAAIVSLAHDKEIMEAILQKSLQQFGEQLYIKHTPIIQQEVHAQVLLLCAGYAHRNSPLRLAMLIRSGAHLSTVSNRLAATSPRVRLLGMLVGEALSSLVDQGGKRMSFKIEETITPESKWYKSLITVVDTVGTVDALRSGPITSLPKLNATSKVKKSKIVKPLQGVSKIVAIEEIEDDAEADSDLDSLAPHEKPDSDAEDSDEDATLVTRNKPTAPVYIRDLITYLRDTDNYDRQKLALQTAAPLIRRKADFGSEVSAHSEELATLLVGLQDKYEMDNFLELRSQGMIAILIANPLKMGQWFSKTFFDGDYSLSQRASVLTTLGLGARELGGFSNGDTGHASTESLPSSSFPSKALPEKMHKLHGSLPHGENMLDKLSTQLSNTMIAPIAAELADKLTGPSVLKVRTFSSRMAVEKKRKKPIANTLAKVVADGFFFPLIGRFFIHLKAYGSTRSNIVFQPYLLTLFIKTLSLLIHASGPSTLSLPQMTSEFWDLLLNLRSQSVGDISVTESLLFGFLTILDINEDKRTLVEVHGRQMLETQEWVEGVFGRLGAGGSEDDERVRVMAAGCLVRIREVVEKYQTLIMGDLATFQN